MLFFFGFSFTACSQRNENTSSEITGESNVAKRVNKDTFKAYLEENPAVKLIDLRTPAEYAAGTILNAQNINFYSPDFKNQLNQLDKDQPVLIFCMSGGRSSAALRIMEEMGFQYVLELAGGYSKY